MIIMVKQIKLLMMMLLLLLMQIDLYKNYFASPMYFNGNVLKASLRSL